MSYAAPFATSGASELPRGYVRPAVWSLCKGYGKLLTDVTVLDGQSPRNDSMACNDSARLNTIRRQQMRDFYLKRSAFGEPLEECMDLANDVATTGMAVHGSTLRVGSRTPSRKVGSGHEQRRRSVSSGSTIPPSSHGSSSVGSLECLGHHYMDRPKSQAMISLQGWQSPSRRSRSSQAGVSSAGAPLFTEPGLGGTAWDVQRRGESPAVVAAARHSRERRTSEPSQMVRSRSVPIGAQILSAASCDKDSVTQMP